MSDTKKLLDMEREFRETVVSKLNDIDGNQKKLVADIDSLDKKMSLHTQKTDYELKAIRELDIQQNAQLAEHIRRTNILEDTQARKAAKIAANEARINELETPGKVFSTLKKWLIGTAATVTAIAAICKFFGLI